MYKESTGSLNAIIASLRSIPSISDAEPRIIIYNKNPSADVHNIQQALNASRVEHIPNVGREGETYLRHIVYSWDDLAKHTIFIQADVHNIREFIPRVRNYFDPALTGMLSLGFSGNVCDCHRCTDRFGWREYSNIFHSVYDDAYGNGTECKQVLLSYKGQFIASARRIRGVRRGLYEELHRAMADEDSWAHQPEYRRGREDSMNAPYFGYTMERLWSLLLQCSDMEIAWRCPTLLSGGRTLGSKADCQCFDNVEQ